MDTANTIVVLPWHDREETVEGPNYLHYVVSCNVDVETGTLTWNATIFSAVHLGHSHEPMISGSKPRTTHVREMSVVGDDVLYLLRDRGVHVLIQTAEGDFPL